MYLVDTNIILEVLLEQEKANEAAELLRELTSRSLAHISRFTLYSLGIILFRRKLHDTFLKLQRDLLIEGGVSIVHADASHLPEVAVAAKRFELDFDDAYQYIVAVQQHLTIVSFDKDFDRTDKGRKTPFEVLQLLQAALPDTNENDI